MCQRNGRRNRPLRQRQRQGRILAAQNPLGPPPQPAILLSNAEPLFISDDVSIGPIPSQAQALPRQGRQGGQFRQARQQNFAGSSFDDGVSSGTIPDENGNYNFE